jgi:uroporphyrinogen-III synthase
MLETLGFDIWMEPLLEINSHDEPAISLAGCQALVFTSANGVRAWAKHRKERSVPIYAVGDATARAARQAGFAHVTSASGNVVALADLIKQKLDAASGCLVHVSASTVAGDLSRLLGEAGFEVHRAVMYEARVVERLSTELISAIRCGLIDGVLVYSPRTGRAFVELLEAAGIHPFCRIMACFCLSEAVVDAITGSGWQRAVIAAAPTEDALIDALCTARNENWTPAADLLSLSRIDADTVDSTHCSLGVWNG